MDTNHHKSPFLINLLILIKNLSKEIMQKLRLRNVFLNTKVILIRKKKVYNKQHNCVVNPLRNDRKNCKLDTRFVTENIIFWKTVNHFCPKRLTNILK